MRARSTFRWANLSLLTIVFALWPAHSSEQSDRLCACLKAGLQDAAKRSSCLAMQEDIVREVGDGSPAHAQFRRDMHQEFAP